MEHHYYAEGHSLLDGRGDTEGIVKPWWMIADGRARSGEHSKRVKTTFIYARNASCLDSVVSPRPKVHS